MSEELDRYLAVGLIRREHGIRGEVKTSPLTDDPERLKKLKKCYLEQNGIYTPINVVSVRLTPQDAIIQFDECRDRDSAARLRNRLLYVERGDAARTEPGAYFLCDLEKCSVWAGGKEIGQIKEIIRTRANDVLCCRMTDGGEMLIPFVKRAVDHVDMEARKVFLTDVAIGEMAVVYEN
ncbi:MAG: 16S rRNA processing protein RimM [Eubacteriales bacterium]|nr:16S rRNA processing protein RimM [Eubacteriales bacterium]